MMNMADVKDTSIELDAAEILRKNPLLEEELFAMGPGDDEEADK